MQFSDSKEEFSTKIKEYRTQIDKIDKKILSLLAKRQQEVSKVIDLKKEFNVPVYHPAREENLISRLREDADGSGIEPDMMEDLYRIILRYSRVSQSGHMKKTALKPGMTVLIVGGAGQMGKYFARLFTRAGYEVRILDKTDWPNAPELCRGVDLAIISVPIDATLSAIAQISPLLDKDTVLADLTSIKQAPLEAMLKCHTGPVMGLHPLFGPTLSSLDKQIIVATPGRQAEACQWLRDQLSLWGAIVIESNAREHDDIMAIVQALRHFATFCFGEFLSKQSIALGRTLEFSSPIYRLEFGMVGRLFAQDGNLYSEIIFATPERRQILKEYILSLNQHLEMLESNDKPLFIEKFRDIAGWFGPFSDQSLRESTFIINKLIERF